MCEQTIIIKNSLKPIGIDESTLETGDIKQKKGTNHSCKAQDNSTKVSSSGYSCNPSSLPKTSEADVIKQNYQ
jgi:hypothetical protein